MFRSIVSKIDKDKDYPARTSTIDVYTRVLEGALYKNLKFGFHQEKNDDNGDYVPLRDRRPTVRYNICRLVVDDSVSLLFSEGHFPTAETDDEKLKEALKDLMKDANLNELMLDAATRGSVGSVAILMRILKQDDGKHKVFLKNFRTTFLTPTFSKANPNKLTKISEQYKVKGETLKELGYAIKDDTLKHDYWFRREWDENSEIWFMPWPVVQDHDQEAKPGVIDPARTVEHKLGFVPWVWIRNLPGDLKLIEGVGTPVFSPIDRACTFAAAIDQMIEIDYQLSQAGRGLKYSMDPTLLIKEPAAPGQGMVKSADMAIVVSEKGDAKLLELTGEGFAVVLEYVRALRELGLETPHGNRANADKISAAQSGRAMELLNQALIWLADRLRVSYGEGALLSLLKMILAANEKYPLDVMGKPWASIRMTDNNPISLRWPRWYQPTSHDRQEQATTQIGRAH